MVIHNQKLSKIILALRRGLIKVNLLYDPDLFLNNHLSGFRPRRSGVPFSKNYIKLSRLVRFVGITTSVTLVLLTLAATFPIVNHQNDAEATYVPATTTLSIVSSKDTASVDITPTSASGTFATSAAADMAEFTVTTDNLTGYSLNILGTDTSGQLVNSTTGDTLDTITADTTENDFRTGNASTYNNKWGYRLTVNSTTTTDFFSAPTSTSTAKTIYTTSAPNTTGTSDSFTLGVGARVDYTKPVGTYTNTFVLTAVANNITYAINYLDNTGDTITDLPAAEGSSNITASSFTLSTTEPQRTGYDFIGWCDGTVTHVASGTDTCAGTTYQAGDTYTFTNISSTSTNTASLYAMWKKGAEALQNWTGCSAMSVGDTVTLIDSRDNEQYLVGKLADGNCWTLENLRLDISDATVQTKLDSTTTNATDTTLGYLKNGGGSSPYPANGVVAAGGSYWSVSYNNPYINNDYRNTVQSASGSAPAGKIGIYYNYCAASAGSYCYAYGVGTGNASEDICPAGWHIPTAGASGQYQALYMAYSSNAANFISALNTPLSGYYGGSSTSRGSYGYFSSSTPYDGSYMLNLSVSSSAVFPVYSGGGLGYTLRSLGLSVRCVSALDGTMQGFTTADKAAMSTGDTRTLKDTRDGQDYTVAKLPDGNVWMTRNLAIGCNGSGSNYGGTITPITLTNTNSNISASTWTTPTNSLTLGGDYTDPRMECDFTYGAWYNYAATTAGTITGSSNFTNATYDICPAGWRLATNAEQTGILSYTTQFNSVVNGGYYRNGEKKPSSDNYWSGTASSATSRYNFYYYAGSLRNGNADPRTDGFYVRCISK